MNRKKMRKEAVGTRITSTANWKIVSFTFYWLCPLTKRSRYPIDRR